MSDLTLTTGYFSWLSKVWNKLMDIKAVMTYAASFKPKNIDRNFRNFHLERPSVRIPNNGPIQSFEYDRVKQVFPQSYTYNGEERDLGDLLRRFHWTGMVVLKNGYIVHEDYARGNSAEDHHIEFSVTKSLTAIIFGIARDEGLIPDLDAQVVDIIPELKGSGYDGVTIQQVLDMTTGIRFTEVYDDLNSDIVRMTVAMLRGSMDEFAKTMVREREPGTYNHYASIHTHILSWIIRKVTGVPFVDYFRDKLWSKIGAESDAYLLQDACGEGMSFAGSSLRLRDLARVGQMVLNGGVSMTGERVVSEEWLQRSTTTDTPQSLPSAYPEMSNYPWGYKNQWWIPTERDGGDFSAIGIYGQFLYINPARKVVIAMNSAYENFPKDELIYEVIPALQAIAKQLSLEANAQSAPV
ncbi:serine hydrolase domain-containing protein [Marinobacter sp. SS21]|uniref:serine hydrolase domain-containing protein n=1 Tax=Marinobacter sp. SS21 TaxID=2979460 RepID=UPI00232D21D2|nr:serine hydrolase [Marinobacter sp. SS21]MDC0663569.1 serine hydrolase [Marinobacter sp. SS21]